jgi:hypothetical protein
MYGLRNKRTPASPAPDGMHAITPHLEAGAKITMPLEDTLWGDHYGRFEDPFGHQSSLAAHIRDVNPEEMQKAAEEMCR